MYVSTDHNSLFEEKYAKKRYYVSIKAIRKLSDQKTERAYNATFIRTFRSFWQKIRIFCLASEISTFCLVFTYDSSLQIKSFYFPEYLQQPLSDFIVLVGTEDTLWKFDIVPAATI